MKTTLIGYGNPLRGDDGIGWYVAGQLADLADETHLQVLACHQLTPELAATVVSSDFVIFVDAECGSTPGALQRTGIVPEPRHLKPGAIGHAMSPEQLLAIARDLYQASPRAALYTICGQCFDHKDSLSPVVQRACDHLIHQVRGLLERLRVDDQIHWDQPPQQYGYA